MLCRLPPHVLLGAVAPLLRWHELRSLHRAGAAIAARLREEPREWNGALESLRRAELGLTRAEAEGVVMIQCRRWRDTVPVASSEASACARAQRLDALLRLAAEDGDDDEPARGAARPTAEAAARAGRLERTRAKTLRALLALGAEPLRGAPRRLVGGAAWSVPPLLHSAAAWSVPHLLRAGVPADIRDAAGNTRLHIAAAGDRDAVAVARVLLAAGADGDARNCARKTPRELALVAGNFDLLAVLAEWDGERRRARRGRLR